MKRDIKRTKTQHLNTLCSISSTAPPNLHEHKSTSSFRTCNYHWNLPRYWFLLHKCPFLVILWCYWVFLSATFKLFGCFWASQEGVGESLRALTEMRRMLGMRAGMRWTQGASLRRGGARGGVIPEPAASRRPGQARRRRRRRALNVPAADAFREHLRNSDFTASRAKRVIWFRSLSTGLGLQFATRLQIS